MEEKIDEILLANFKEGDWQTAKRELLDLFVVRSRREQLIDLIKKAQTPKGNCVLSHFIDNL
jgi:hypothetical protein